MGERQLMLIIKRHEEKLREYMGDEAYMQFAKDVAKEAFFQECTELPDGEFKDFCLDNFFVITSDTFGEDDE